VSQIPLSKPFHRARVDGTRKLVSLYQCTDEQGRQGFNEDLKKEEIKADSDWFPSRPSTAFRGIVIQWDRTGTARHGTTAQACTGTLFIRIPRVDIRSRHLSQNVAALGATDTV